MTTKPQELESYAIGTDGLRYVPIKDAAKYLDISRSWLEDLITFGKVEATRFENKIFIELETLKAFTDSRKPTASAWDRLDEWRARG